MRKFLFATVGLVALAVAAPASAADLAARPYTKAPPPVVAPIYDWTGFYIGANGGWGSAHNCWSAGAVGGVLVADGCSNQSGGLFGGQLGYRWQTNQFVFGVEGQGDWANLSRTRFSVINPLISEQAKVDGIGLITGQLGWAWNAALLSASRCCWMRASISSRSRNRSSARTPRSEMPHLAIRPRRTFRRNSASSPSGMSG